MICLLAATAILAQGEATLPNGVRLRVVPIADSQVVSVQAFVRLGSVDDPNPGAAHLLEHMLFRRNLSADRKAEAAGGELNATTYREFMRIEFCGPSSASAIGVQCVAQLLSPPQFGHLDVEKRVALQEIASRSANVSDATSLRLWSSAAARTAYANPPMGIADAIPLVDDKSLLDLYRKHFVGSGIAVVITGDVVVTETLASLQAAFTGFSNLAPPALPKFLESAISEKDAWALPAPGIDDLKRYAAYLTLTDLLLSKLSPEVRFEFGLSAAGSLCVIQAEQAGATRLKALLSKQIEADDIKQAAMRLVQRFEKPTDVTIMGVLQGFGLLFGNPDLQSQIIGAVRALTPQDVQKVADEWAQVVGK